VADGFATQALLRRIVPPPQESEQK
jgi:hypothetical protein